MILKLSKNIDFYKYYRKFNLLSLIFIFLSIFTLFFNGLNLGVDFKGGTLIELRMLNDDIKISNIRSSLLNMNLGDVTVKKFGN